MSKPHLGLLLLSIVFLSGCRVLVPRAIDNSKQNIAPELIAANTLPIERGKPRPIIDGIGWVVGI
ncbi:MAG: hypothetical protein ACKO3V_15045, partial [Pirellula sp.]